MCECEEMEKTQGKMCQDLGASHFGTQERSQGRQPLAKGRQETEE